MESQSQNPEFRNNPENFHPCLHYLPYSVFASREDCVNAQAGLNNGCSMM